MNASRKRGGEKQANPLLKACRLVDLFRDLDNTIPAQTIATYLYVAASEGSEIAQSDLEKALDLAQSSTSRNVDQLTVWCSRLRRPGAGLVEAFENPLNRRSKLVRLTPKGRALAAKIEEILE